MMNKTMSLTQINDILMQFGQNIGVRDLRLDHNLAASLVFDDQFLVEIHGLDRSGDHVNSLFLLSVLSPAPNHFPNDIGKADFYRQLLHANLSHKVMSGVSFSVDPESGDIILLRALVAHYLTIDILEYEIETFINVLEHWSNTLVNGVLDFSQINKSKSGEKNIPAPKDNPKHHNGAAIRI